MRRYYAGEKKKRELCTKALCRCCGTPTIVGKPITIYGSGIPVIFDDFTANRFIALVASGYYNLYTSVHRNGTVIDYITVDMCVNKDSKSKKWRVTL